MKHYALIIGFLGLWITGCESSTESEEESMYTVTIENIAIEKSYFASGAFNTPVGASAPAPIFPGEAYEVNFDAAPGHKLSFATMFVQSNDFFYAPDGEGIDLFDALGNQVTGNITSQVMLWDVGSEVNQEPGLGADQAPRQNGPNTGAADVNTNVRQAPDDFNNLPAVSDVIEVTLTSTSATGFTLRIEAVSTASTLSTSDDGMTAVPLAPGVYVVHTGSDVLFMEGQADYGDGLVAIAEDGDPSSLADELAMETGVTELIAPGVFVLHESGNPLFSDNSADRGEGLENLAEDGDPSLLHASVENDDMVDDSGVFNTPVGSSSPAPVGPGQSYSFSFNANDDAYLSFATMLVQSNDLFIAPDPMGIMLEDMEGDISSYLSIWDAGTEVNEKPGVGLNQAPRQSGVDTGVDEMGVVKEVDDGFDYPALADILRVTIEKM